MEHKKIPQGGGLFIERKQGESILMIVNGEVAMINVVHIGGKRVKLSIVGDRNKVAFVRGELTRKET